MRVRGRTFAVDRENGKLFGVCAGIANATGVDATIVRIAVVALAILTSFVAICVLYGVAAAVGHQRRAAAPVRLAQSDELRDRMRAHDLRMQAIETYTASANSRLAREIEELR
jgi:phage shock protein C